MDKQTDTVTEVNLSEVILRDLLDCEIMSVGGGEASLTIY